MATERTLVLIKPDGVNRNLIGRILSYYESAGFVIRAMKMLTVSHDVVAGHYILDDAYLLSLGEKGIKAGEKLETDEEKRAYGAAIVAGLRDYLSSGPIVAAILEGDDAVKKVRVITGYTDPSVAAKGTIRGDMGEDSIAAANADHRRPVKNLIHASGTTDEADREIAHWFSKDELAA